MRILKVIMLAVIVCTVIIAGIFVYRIYHFKNQFDFEREQTRLNILNSRFDILEELPYECDWSKLTAGDTFDDFNLPKSVPLFRYDVFPKEYLTSDTSLIQEEGDEVASNFAVKSEEEALDLFFKANEIDTSVYFYKDLPEIKLEAGVKAAYDYVPIYQKVGDNNLYAFDLELWKNSSGLYKVITSPAINTYPFYQIDKEGVSYSVPLLSKEQIVELVKSQKIKKVFIALSTNGYEYCNDVNLAKIELNGMQIVYDTVSQNHIYPFVKLDLNLVLGDKNIALSLLVDPLDTSKINESTYIDAAGSNLADNMKSIVYPPEISSIELTGNTYKISGNLPYRGFVHISRDSGWIGKLLLFNEKWLPFTYKDLEIQLVDNGDYGGVLAPSINVNKTIKETLNIDPLNGDFEFNFDSDVFWKIYDEASQQWVNRNINVNSQRFRLRVCFTPVGEFGNSLQKEGEEARIYSDYSHDYFLLLP